MKFYYKLANLETNILPLSQDFPSQNELINQIFLHLKNLNLDFQLTSLQKCIALMKQLRNAANSLFEKRYLDLLEYEVEKLELHEKNYNRVQAFRTGRIRQPTTLEECADILPIYHLNLYYQKLYSLSPSLPFFSAGQILISSTGSGVCQGFGLVGVRGLLLHNTIFNYKAPELLSCKNNFINKDCNALKLCYENYTKIEALYDNEDIYTLQDLSIPNALVDTEPYVASSFKDIKESLSKILNILDDSKVPMAFSISFEDGRCAPHFTAIATDKEKNYVYFDANFGIFSMKNSQEFLTWFIWHIQASRYTEEYNCVLFEKIMLNSPYIDYIKQGNISKQYEKISFNSNAAQLIKNAIGSGNIEKDYYRIPNTSSLDYQNFINIEDRHMFYAIEKFVAHYKPNNEEEEMQLQLIKELITHIISMAPIKEILYSYCPHEPIQQSEEKNSNTLKP